MTAVGSCNTSSIGRPTAVRNGTPEIDSAARLNVRMRCDRSVVTRPLGRLSMTCWLNACRSAISVDARSSRAPAERRLSASDPLRTATAKKPKTFSTTVYRATDRAGSVGYSGNSHMSGSNPAADEVLPENQADVEHGAQRRHQQAAAAELHRRAGGDRQDVERREVAGDTAGEVDERRDDQRVAGQLQVHQPPGAGRPGAASPRS